MAKTTYRMCGGLAIMPGHDMAMLKRMSAKGWHVRGINRALLYRFEQGEPHDYDYAVDFQRDFSEEARELYGLGGWEPVVLGSGWQIVRAEAGTTPLYTDDDAEAETLRESRKGLGVRALLCAVAAALLFVLQARLSAQGNEPASRRAWPSRPGSFSRSSPSSGIRAPCARSTPSRKRTRAADVRPYLGYTVQVVEKGARTWDFSIG